MEEPRQISPIGVLRAIEEWITGLVKAVITEAMVSEAIDVVLKNRAVLTEETLETQLKAMDKRGELCWVGGRIRDEVQAEIEDKESVSEASVKEIVESELENCDFIDERRVDTMIEDALEEFYEEHLEDELTQRIKKIVGAAMDDEVATLVKNTVERLDWEAIWLRHLQPSFVNALGMELERAVQALSERRKE